MRAEVSYPEHFFTRYPDTALVKQEQHGFILRPWASKASALTLTSLVYFPTPLQGKSNVPPVPSRGWE